jgi:hypothetical protein
MEAVLVVSSDMGGTPGTSGQGGEVEDPHVAPETFGDRAGTEAKAPAGGCAGECHAGKISIVLRRDWPHDPEQPVGYYPYGDSTGVLHAPTTYLGFFYGNKQQAKNPGPQVCRA